MLRFIEPECGIQRFIDKDHAGGAGGIAVHGHLCHGGEFGLGLCGDISSVHPVVD